MNTPRLFARPQTEPRGMTSELALRYGAATLVTLIALAAAQLVVPTKFVLVLGAITLLGVPVSLWMRLHDMRIGSYAVPRPLWNALTVIASFSASAYFLRVPLRNIFGALQGGMNEAALLSMGATEPMLLLVRLFLIFAAFRSFSLISDKDATLATVPSFSVLLLLIPVYPNIEVVCYFLAWTLVATMLFALDHRSEIHAKVMATVPAPAPGQDVKLAARSLAGVLSFSLVAAIALSGLLTARDPRQASSSDSAVTLLATRLMRFTLQNQDSSQSSGPERQIDFSSGTSLPTRAELWKTSTFTWDGKPINPLYWRLFTLSDYNGSAWTQNNIGSRLVQNVTLPERQWPRPNGGFGGAGFGDFGNGNGFRDNNGSPNDGGGSRNDGGDSRGEDGSRRRGDSQGEGGDSATFGGRRTGRPRKGFDLSKALPELAINFGRPSERVIYRITAQRTSLGFVPLLPAPLRLSTSKDDQDSVRVRNDGGVDMNLAEPNQYFTATSQVPRLPEYGFIGATPPMTKIVAPSGSGQTKAPTLSADERASYLRLPAALPSRVRGFARDATQSADADSSNYARAALLASATQRGAIYTLRPPTIPPERDATDFFLFESRRGYCTYFAGALTVLCRAQGIPARVVSGFVSPDEVGQGESMIRDANAHAWTEVWVENWGWAVVDATPADDRGDNAPTFLENWSDLTAANLDIALRWFITRWPALVSVFGVLLLSFGFWRFRGAIGRALGHETVEDVETLRRQVSDDYTRVARQLARRFRPRQTWETPDEWLRAAHVELPQLPFEALQTLTALYVRARFSPHELGREATQQARQARERVVWPKRKSVGSSR